MNLEDKTVAFLVADGFELSELTSTMQQLKGYVCKIDIISPMYPKVKAWNKGNWAEAFSVDVELKKADHTLYDALILPGGVINPDRLRREPLAAQFVKQFFNNSNKRLVAAICHGPQLLIEANVIKGKTLTSFPSIKTDLINAGAHWVDKQVCIDDNLVTSRTPADLDAFNTIIIERLCSNTYERKSS